VSDDLLASIPLLSSIHPTIATELVESLPTRAFAPGEQLCREGESGSSMFIITRGLADVRVGTRVETINRLRRGDVIGEMSLLTGEPRTATVEATVPTEALELDQATFAGTLSRHPELFAGFTRILIDRLARTTQSQAGGSGRGEAITLVVGTGHDRFVDEVTNKVGKTSPGRCTAVDLRGASVPAPDRVEAALAELDDLLAANATVLVVVPIDFPELALLASQTDRAVLVTDGSDDESVVHGLAGAPPVEVAPARDANWLSRHLARTKLGLALGAGGAKGYSHVGALRVLEEAGYEFDCVAGSSIGAVVGVCLGMGMDSHAIEQAMRELFTPENVTSMFTLSFAGTSSGASTMHQMLERLTEGRTFADLRIPVTVMTVDLEAKEPRPIDDGPLLDALLAATALAGFVPPVRRGDERLVDALALMPVPSDAARRAGADVTLSVNLMSRRVLPAWPGQTAPEVAERRERMLDVLLEVMDLGQVDSSIRSAAMADVVVTPEFGPATWRDFDLADLFLAAGRAAAEEQLAALEAFAHSPR
jgi:NTE family protein